MLQVHRCNKLANRHVRVGLADPNAVPRCDICENAPGMQIFIMSNMLSVFVRGSERFKLLFLFLNRACAAFFYCEVDGSSLCLQCDMIVHVGGKRTHGRYLVLRQRIEVCFCGIELDHIYSSECYAKTYNFFFPRFYL
ncbi:hypothetical protein CsSME_00005951 [Camellia sinensis var. sinensis]